MSALFRSVSLPLVLVASLGTSPAWAQSTPLGGMITGLDIDRIAEIARPYGAAERQPDDEDGPWIRADMEGTVYTISFLNCTNATNCTSVQFRAWWNSEGAHTVEMMNQWNRDRRFSDAYLDNRGNATIEFDVNLAGGVTAVNFDDTVQWWQAVLREFRSTVIDPGYEAANPNPQPPSQPQPPAQPPALSK
jgi:hypothetical protein